MNRHTICVLILLAFTLTSAAAAQTTMPSAGLCIGVYDPRAIAIAYVHSSFFNSTMKEKQAEFRRAKAAGDKAKIQELNAWGQNQQIRIHLQGFAAAPVDDLLALVAPKLPQVAAAAGVDAICLQPNYTLANVATIDVTDRLVALFTTDPGALKTIAGLRKNPPLPMEQIATMPANQ